MPEYRRNQRTAHDGIVWCPRCNVGKGTPIEGYKSQYDGRYVELAYKCQACNRIWIPSR